MIERLGRLFRRESPQSSRIEKTAWDVLLDHQETFVRINETATLLSKATDYNTQVFLARRVNELCGSVAISFKQLTSRARATR